MPLKRLGSHPFSNVGDIGLGITRIIELDSDFKDLVHVG